MLSHPQNIRRRISRDSVHLRQGSDPGIPRRRMQRADPRVRGQPPNKSVLPPATTDNKYSHGTGAYRAPSLAS